MKKERHSLLTKYRIAAMPVPRSTRLILFLVLLASCLSAQQEFESGYLIDPTGQRSEVLILNRDWRYNPATIEVRTSAGAPTRLIATDSLSEFGIGDKARYVNREVFIDRNSTELKYLTYTPAPPKAERILLRVEVAGPATLYSYLAPQLRKFFLSLDGGVPQQLTYSRTLVGDGKVVEDRAFIGQLSSQLRCGTDGMISDRMGYTLREIRNAVTAYHACSGTDSYIFDNVKAGSKSVQLTFLPGIYVTDMQVSYNDRRGPIANVQNQVVLRPAIELAFTLPFWSDKLAMLFRPSVYRFSASGPDVYYDDGTVLTASYRAVDLPLGLRYYSFLGDDVRLFATGSLGYTIARGELVRSRREPLVVREMLAFAAEAGIRYRDRWSAIVGYETNTTSLHNVTIHTKTEGLRLMVGYTL